MAVETYILIHWLKVGERERKKEKERERERESKHAGAQAWASYGLLKPLSPPPVIHFPTKSCLLILLILSKVPIPVSKHKIYEPMVAILTAEIIDM